MPPHTPSTQTAKRRGEELIKKASLLVAGTSSIATVASLLGGAEPAVSAVAGMMAVLGWLALLLSRWLAPSLVTHIVVFGTLLIATVDAATFGAARSSGSILYMAAVAAAGTFLGRRALLAAAGFSIASFGLISMAENLGYLHPKSLHAGFTTWFAYSCVLMTVASLVHYGRNRSKQAHDRQKRALEDNRRLALERDQSLERFARIFRLNPSPMITQSAQSSVILDVNPAFERCYGYTCEAIVGQTDEVLWGRPDQRRGYLKALGQDKRAALSNVIGLRADGSMFDAQISSELSDEGDDNLVITAVTDISAQVATIERLRRSEDRFSKAFNFSPLKLMITRLNDDTVVEVGQTLHHGAERAAIEYRGRPATEAGPWFDAEDRAAFVQRLLQDGHLAAYPTMLTHPDGSTIDAKVWAEQIDIDGEPCILSCTVDITEEKRRDELLQDIAKGMTGHTAQAFFESLTERMAIALGADQVLIGEVTSDQWVNTLSVFKEGACSANGRFPLVGTVCEHSLQQTSLTVYASGLSAHEGRPDLLGDGVIDALVCQALHDEDGQVIGVLSAMWAHPIPENEELRSLMAIFSSRAHAELMRLRSERHIAQLNSTLEQRVSERTAELIKLNAELDSFAYSISHDLKSPLRAIDGFTQLLSERLDPKLEPDERQLMDRILGATHRMANLMADLLALTRISQGEMHLRDVNLSALVHAISGNLLKTTPRPGLTLRIAPNVVRRCDENLAQIALTNLIQNALKYTRDQPRPVIEFGELTDAPQDEALDLFIQDNGIGFDMAHADKLFKPFQRLHMPSAGFEGTGIGLATVRRIVERHGGLIKGSGIPREGARFTFTFSPRTASAPTDVVEKAQIEA